MTDERTLLVGITKIGTTPSLFDTKYHGLIDPVSRRTIGLPDTEDIQTSVFCGAPDNIDKYWAFSMTVDELKRLYKDGRFDTSKFTIKLWSVYTDSNTEFFSELQAVNE